MKAWESTLVGPASTLREALDRIDRTGHQIALVVDDQRRLLGTLSDGDARRALLTGLSLDAAVTSAMHTTPTCVRPDDDLQTVLSMMRRLGLHQVPVLDASGAVVGLQTINDFLKPSARENQVVIMAGGLGQRLQELTRDTPKPMLKVGPRPLLESIIRNLASQGFSRFLLAVNYRAEQIEQHFGDGTELGVEIRYLREHRRLGTAGALSLLPQQPELPIVVTNADLLAQEDFGAIVDCHVQCGAVATMAVRDYEMQVPFGVVHSQNDRILAIHEKPTHNFLVSAGIYVFSPEALDVIPADEYLDMPAMFEALIQQGHHCRAQPIRGYWLDIGRIPDYERANREFSEVFK